MSLVPISLTDRQEHASRSRARRKRNHRYRTYESVLTLPQSRPKGRVGLRQRQAERRARVETQDTDRADPLLRRIPWRSFTPRIPALILLMATLALGIYGSSSATFFVYEAQIQGNRHINTERIFEASGVNEQHILWVDPRDVVQKVSQIPGVKSVNVRLSFPAHVLIQVTEREPVIMWRTMSVGGDWWLDEEGWVLPYHGDTENPDTIYVIDWSDRQLGPGVRLDPPDLVQGVKEMAEALPGIRLFYYQQDRGLNFIQERDQFKWPVYVGDGQDLTLKIRSVQALSDYLLAHGIYPGFIDVRWPELPVFGEPGVSAMELEN